MWKNNVEGIRDKAAVALAKKSLLQPKTASAEVCATPVALSDEDEKSSNSIRLMHIIGDSAIHDSPNRLKAQWNTRLMQKILWTTFLIEILYRIEWNLGNILKKHWTFPPNY